MKSWLGRLVRSRTARDTLVNSLGTGVAAALSLGTLVLATRTLGPSSYGLFALALAVLSIAAELADVGLNAGLIRHVSRHLGRGDREAARAVVSVAFRAKIAAAAAGGLLVLALAGPASSALDRAVSLSLPKLQPNRAN